MRRTHVAGGALAGALAGLHAGPWSLAVGAAAGGLSALAPDVDHTGTPASRVPVAGWVLSRALRHWGVAHSPFLRA
jgi:membrane-bound metal-dependent hydrolase YbcI (DUF457 family)